MLHTTIRDFADRYDRDAILSLESLSTSQRRGAMNFSFEAVDIPKAVSLFEEYLDGYCDFAEARDEISESTREMLMTNLGKFINGEKITDDDPVLFETKRIGLDDSPGYVRGFIESIDSLIGTLDKKISRLKKSGVEPESIGLMSEMCDAFADALAPKVNASIDYCLLESGYVTRKWVDSLRPKPAVNQPAVVFA